MGSHLPQILGVGSDAGERNGWGCVRPERLSTAEARTAFNGRGPSGFQRQRQGANPSYRNKRSRRLEKSQWLGFSTARQSCADVSKKEMRLKGTTTAIRSVSAREALPHTVDCATSGAAKHAEVAVLTLFVVSPHDCKRQGLLTEKRMERGGGGKMA